MMKHLTTTARGAVIVAVAVLWQGIGTSIIGYKVKPELSTFTTFSAFLIAAVIALFAFRTSALIRRSEPTGKERMRLTTALSLNLFTAGAFCFFYVSTTLMQPTAASVIETAVGPLLVASIITVTTKKLSSAFIASIVVFALALAFFYLSGNFTEKALWGLVLAIGAGLSAVGVLYSSRAASAEGNSIAKIASVRFHLAWIISGAVAVFSVDWQTLDSGIVLSTALLSTVCITFPILLLQWGITLAPPLTSSLILAALPAVVMATDIFLGATADLPKILLLSSIVLITVSQALWSARYTNEDSSN